MQSNFVLNNPITKITGKSIKDLVREDLITVIEKKEIERITFHYTAIDGKLKELKIPVTSRYKAEQILAEGERVDGSSLFRGMVDLSLSDLYVVPVYKTAFLNPFDDGSLDFICRYLNKDGEPALFALDNILLKAFDFFRKNTGLELQGFGELEFFLLTETKGNSYIPTRQRGYHESFPFIKSGKILDEMVRVISQITESVKYSHSEVGFIENVRSDLPEIKSKMAEQLEIEFLPAPITEAADFLVLSRWLIRNVAYKYGCVATFAPKIEEGIAGNGLHIHLSIKNEGKNIMNDPGGKLSLEGKKLIGGLCKFADTLTAFGNTESAAYLRLVPNQEAPTRICWSDLNRSAMIRVPLGWSGINNLASRVNPGQKPTFVNLESRQTAELRSPDGSALIHLLLAGMCLAAEWGLSNEESLKLAEDLYVSGNIFKNKELLDKLPILPKSCVESAELLEQKRSFYENSGIFPAGIIDYIVNMLKGENDKNMNQILADLPADDRLHKTRNIMHKYLHRH